MTDVSGLTLHQKSNPSSKVKVKSFDEGLGPKRQSHLYSVVLEFFLSYSNFLLYLEFIVIMLLILHSIAVFELSVLKYRN